jgi:hypothetical protein
MTTRALAATLSIVALIAGALAACGEDTQDTSPGTTAGPASSSGAGATGAGGEGVASSSMASTAASGGGGAGAAGGGGTGGGGGSGGAACSAFADPCASCAFDQCPAEYCTCFASSECISLTFCAQACAGPDFGTCLGDCFQKSPTAPADFLLVADCAATQCAASCADATTLTPCEKCAAQKCEPDFDTCLANPECWKIIQCVRNCTTSSCKMACPSQFPGGEADSATLYACTGAQCSAECQ